MSAVNGWMDRSGRIKQCVQYQHFTLAVEITDEMFLKAEKVLSEYDLDKLEDKMVNAYQYLLDIGYVRLFVSYNNIIKSDVQKYYSEKPLSAEQRNKLSRIGTKLKKYDEGMI